MKNWIKTLVIASSLLVSTTTTAMAATTVKIGMSGRYFPFTFVSQDKLQGFEVDLWHAIGKRNDYNVEFITASFSGLFGQLETGRIDTISNQISITPARQAKFLFSQPYVIDGAQLVVRKGNNSIHSTADLEGKTVGVNLGSNYEQLLRNLPNANNIDIKTYDSGIEQDVALGRTDAFVMDRLSSMAIINSKPLPLQLAGKPFATIENAWPFLNNAKGKLLQQQVNHALAAMRKDGTLAAISDKWFHTDITQ
ncbi:amino acid ABC transporter substrate-binding protein [Photobacterium toruni]|uniref:Amino acid ABC transporter substrate-binding protein n=1 Tax=Photobacterium toruni TaxID=1935446 RepID=A0A1T4UP61_9GAMM|nr:amino acid ABC transporter substrate-binding protein [Photobacterium toruni]MEC6833266.1 amino acid ABC transporter substrate-binding protein [Photobacterium toruni]SKA54378.1 putative amino-acid-binding protein YxeM precursor [Photobacterium toruni]